MTETLVLAAGAPAAIAAIWLASRRSWSPAAADSRGIALQTVIVIVVMLVIAGAVSAVLLSRGSDVVGELEAQDISASATYTDAASCATLFGLLESNVKYTDPSGGNPQKCVATGTTAIKISAAACVGNGGAFDDSVTNGQCTLVG